MRLIPICPVFQARACEELAYYVQDEIWKVGLRAQERGLDPESMRPQLQKKRWVARFQGIASSRESSTAKLGSRDLALQMVELDRRGF